MYCFKSQTLIGTLTHQKAQEVVVPTWHNVNCEQLFLKNLHAFQQIKMNDESFVEKLKRIVRKKEEHQNMINERKKETQEALVVEFKTQGMTHTSHSRVTNPTPL